MNKIDTQWQKAQEQIFIEWINETLPNNQITNIQEDIQDGTILIQLIEKLKGKKCQERIIDHPKMRIQKISNCTIALRFIHQCYNIKTVCSAENIVDCQQDSKYLLGLLFQLYLQHHKSMVISSQPNQQQQYTILLQWLQQTIGDYHLQIDTKENMMKNIYNGKILVALLDCFFEQHHQFFDYMIHKGEGERIGLSLRMAHDLLGVSELLTTEDVIAHQIDSRVLFFYFDFMMNAFKTKSRIAHIDLIQLVEEGIKQLNEKLKKEELSSQNDINLSKTQHSSSSSSSEESNQEDNDSSNSSTDESTDEEDDNDKQQRKRTIKKHQTEMKHSKPIVLKDVLYKGRVQQKDHKQPIQSTQVSLHESYKYNQPQQSILIHRKQEDLPSKHHHKHRKHHHHLLPQSYSETTTETITTTSSIPNQTYTRSQHTQTSETIVSYSFWFI